MSTSIKSDGKVRVGGVMVRVVSLVRVWQGTGIGHPVDLAEWVWLNPCIKLF